MNIPNIQPIDVSTPTMIAAQGVENVGGMAAKGFLQYAQIKADRTNLKNKTLQLFGELEQLSGVTPDKAQWRKQYDPETITPKKFEELADATDNYVSYLNAVKQDPELAKVAPGAEGIPFVPKARWNSHETVKTLSTKAKETKTKTTLNRIGTVAQSLVPQVNTSEELVAATTKKLAEEGLDTELFKPDILRYIQAMAPSFADRTTRANAGSSRGEAKDKVAKWSEEQSQKYAKMALDPKLAPNKKTEFELMASAFQEASTMQFSDAQGANAYIKNIMKGDGDNTRKEHTAKNLMNDMSALIGGDNQIEETTLLSKLKGSGLSPLEFTRYTGVQVVPSPKSGGVFSKVVGAVHDLIGGSAPVAEEYNTIPNQNVVQTVTTPQEYNALPPGTKYKAPDGTIRTKGK